MSTQNAVPQAPAPREKREPKSTRVSGTTARMPDWYYEDRPCALSRPKFVRIPLRDEEGNIMFPVVYRMKKVGKPSCESGLSATGSYTHDGKIFYLCNECGPNDVRHYCDGDKPTVEAPAPDNREFAFPPAERRDETTILVRLTPDTGKLRDKLVAAGFVAADKVKLARKRGFQPVRVATFTRKPA